MDNFIEQITKVIHWILGVLLTVMLGITFVQVVLRYVFNSPLIWADEVTLFLLVWYGFMIIAVLIKTDGHISLEFLYLKFNKTHQKVLDLIRHILIFGFSMLMIYFGYEMFNNAEGKYFPASHIPRSLVNLPMIISGLLIVLYTINHLIHLFRPIGKREEEKND